MVDVANLDHVIASLRVSDVRAAAALLAEQVVPGQLADDEVVGLCWATVDLDRTVADVALPFTTAQRDRHMGATAARVHIGGLTLLVEEPDTEGRQAAFLARFGEGLSAVFVARTARHDVSARRSEQTPIGRPGWLMPHEWPWGPFVIAIDPSGQATR